MIQILWLIPGSFFSSSQTSCLSISTDKTHISFTVTLGFFFSMISRTVSAQLEEVLICFSFSSEMPIFLPRAGQLLKWSNWRQIISNVSVCFSRRSSNVAVSTEKLFKKVVLIGGAHFLWLARIHRKVLAVKICSQYTTKNLGLLKTWPHARESVSNDDVSELNAPKEIKWFVITSNIWRMKTAWFTLWKSFL